MSPTLTALRRISSLGQAAFPCRDLRSLADSIQLRLPSVAAQRIEQIPREPALRRMVCRTFSPVVEERRSELHIRLFEQCILWWLGGRRHADMLVNDHVNMFVVNTDGGYEYPDYFRAHTDGGSRTRFNVDNHSITDLAGDSGFRYCLSLIDYVPAECSGCDVLGLCGGGFLPGRMSDEAGLPGRSRCSATTSTGSSQR